MKLLSLLIVFFIDTVSDPASGLFQHYSVRLSVVSISEESVDLLCTERLISNETRTQVETAGGFLLGDSLREIRTSITEDHNKLRSLGDILLKSDETKTIGQDILKESGNINTHIDSDTQCMSSILSIFILLLDELFSKSDDTSATISSSVPPSVTNNDTIPVPSGNGLI